ncbi:class I SAM-dependent methyltransferase [Streptomyces sp. NPDC020379]|uniref:class I SAM-dependent methyltransferase n=1 Tax=Streptomyces sp. NPDC020379 TaxID=3365071 RepID=UPI0037B56EC2
MPANEPEQVHGLRGSTPGVTQEGYGERVLSPAQTGEAGRLAALTEACDPATMAALASLPLAPDSRCLDMGAGTGTIAQWLLARCPAGTVVAADIDTRFLKGLTDPRLRIRQHDIRASDFPPASFDFIHARNLLSHLPGRDEAVARMVTWLAPGGYLYIEDVSLFPIDTSPHPAYRAIMQAASAAVTHAIGSDLHGWARSYPRPLLTNGLTGIGLRVHCAPITATNRSGVIWRQTIEQVRSVMIENGTATADGIDHGLACLADPAFVDIAPAMIAAWGRTALPPARPQGPGHT